MTKNKRSCMMLRMIAAAMAVALVAGTAVMTPVADVIGISASITVNATNGEVTGVEELQTALNNGGTVKLGANITTGTAITVSGVTCTLDLNGYTLTYTGSENYFFTLDGADMTIKGNGTFNSNSKSVISASNSTVTVNGGEFKADSVNFHISGNSDLTVNNGTFESLNSYNVYARDNSEVVINKGYFSANSNSIYTYGNATAQVKCGLFKSNPNAYVASGYTSEYLSSKRMYIVYKGTKITGSTSWIIVDEEPNNGNDYDYTLYIFGETGGDSNGYPWDSNKARIKKAIALQGAKSGSDFSNLFYNCSYVTEVDFYCLDTSNTTNMARMFRNCPRLESITLGGKFKTSNVTNMEEMFRSCTALTALDVSDFDTSNVENMSDMFSSCKKIKELDVSSFNVSNVTTMSSMFSGCYELEQIKGLENWSGTTKLTTVGSMFSSCQKIKAIDVSNLDTSHVTKMSSVFSGCYELSSIAGLDQWDTSSVTDMSSMFSNASALTSLDLSGFDTKNVENMYGMFSNASALTSLNVNGWNIGKVRSMSSMFEKTSSLTSLDLSSFGTSGITSTYCMFRNASSLISLDLTNFDTSSVTSMREMFSGCANLSAVYVGDNWNTDNVTTSVNMFANCSEKLVGGAGTTWNSGNSTDHIYARIDGKNGQPGYFIQGPAPLKTYTVTWLNYDGTALETDENVEEGTIPTYNSATPAKPADAQYTYTFSGWDSEPTAVTGDVTYIAQYTSTIKTYTVTWLNADGSVLEIDEGVVYGELPVYNGDLPSKEADERYTYDVIGWDKDFEPVTSDVTYTAIFDAVPIAYTITWVNGDGSTTTDTFAYGETPVYRGETPTKPADGQYTYTFDGWLPEITAVTGDVTYTAQFTEKFNGYTVTFDSNGGTAVDSQTVEENATVTIPEAPSKDYSTFDGWYLDGTLYDFDTPVTENITLTAHWTEQTVAIRFMDSNGEEKSALTITPVNNSFEDTSEQIAVPSAPYRDGYTFSGWQVGDNLYATADALKNALTALVAGVPEDAIIVNEVYAQIEVQYPAMVTGGTIRNAQGDTNGSYKASEQVYVTATGGSAGQVFSHWEKSDIGNPTPVIVSYEKTYAFRMPSFGTTLTAVYKNKPEEKTGTAYIESVTARDGNKLSFVSIVAIPNKSTILRAGLVACMEKDLKNGHTAPTIDYARFKKYNSTTCQNYTTFKYTWTKGNVAENEVWCVRSYLLYEDENGVQHTVYGDMVKANSDGVITE